ncbi:cobyrinic acid a,c-diamide synthase, partial [Parageobacillus sp. SY1]
DDVLHIPARHLGLIPSIERGELDHFFAELGKRVAETVDLDALLKLAEAPALNVPQSYFDISKSYDVRIAV